MMHAINICFVLMAVYLLGLYLVGPEIIALGIQKSVHKLMDDYTKATTPGGMLGGALGGLGGALGGGLGGILGGGAGAGAGASAGGGGLNPAQAPPGL
jgi:hypothetical protein